MSKFDNEDTVLNFGIFEENGKKTIENFDSNLNDQKEKDINEKRYYDNIEIISKKNSDRNSLNSILNIFNDESYDEDLLISYSVKEKDKDYKGIDFKEIDLKFSNSNKNLNNSETELDFGSSLSSNGFDNNYMKNNNKTSSNIKINISSQETNLNKNKRVNPMTKNNKCNKNTSEKKSKIMKPLVYSEKKETKIAPKNKKFNCFLIENSIDNDFKNHKRDKSNIKDILSSKVSSLLLPNKSKSKPKINKISYISNKN